ncbi:MAG: histidine kinase N-terminal 7TM domain-containing protein [Candidatus Margulisbacteria bacterium]|nr:histidine kinase N-terminal 7TM domain-containing protein [Candidatus Margulisiibacteriota bacterium]
MSEKLYYNVTSMAMFFPYFELAASLFILLLAFQIWTRHYENKLARFFALFAFIAFLAAILTYSLRIAFTLEIARDINRLSATLWAFVFALYAHFALLFTKKDAFLKKPLSYLLLYLPPTVIGILFVFTNLMYSRHEIASIGIISQPAPLYSLFTVETFGFCLWGIVLLLQYARTTPQKIERTQAIIIAIGSMIPVAVGVINDMVLPVLTSGRPTPPTVVFDVAIMNLFIYIAMRRFSLFAISPALAADTIIETMPDSLLVTDLGGRIIFLNEDAQKFFRVPKEEVAGHNITDLFKQKEKFNQLYSEAVEKKLEVERFEADLVDPLGERIPALINARLLREKIIGETIGIVFVIRDIRG